MTDVGDHRERRAYAICHVNIYSSMRLEKILIVDAESDGNVN
jgi:hypothetical protein